jgi:septal ring factor EnvC (AmiA/AmiB activator)
MLCRWLSGTKPKERLVLLECVLGALGLAIEEAASGEPSEDRFGYLHDKTNHLKQTLRRRLAALVERRRRIEVLKRRLQNQQTPADLERLQAALARREQLYQERLSTLRRGRRKLARLEKELSGLRAAAAD